MSRRDQDLRRINRRCLVGKKPDDKLRLREQAITAKYRFSQIENPFIEAPYLSESKPADNINANPAFTRAVQPSALAHILMAYDWMSGSCLIQPPTLKAA